ncbi:RNA-directed DNA polymerase, eukaryota [Tanacetum coccineum]
MVRRRMQSIGMAQRVSFRKKDEECVCGKDFSNGAMGWSLYFDSHYQLHSLSVDEGFEVNPDFVSDERVVWLDIEGVPLYAWSRKSFDKIEEGEFNNSEDEEVAETDFMEKSSQSMEHSVHVDKEISADPFGLNDLLGLKKPVEENLEPSPSLSHPPGFSPVGSLNSSDKELNKEFSPTISARGSVLGVLDEMIRVGRAMGYSMEGWLGSKSKKEWVKELSNNNKLNFIAIQETKMEKVSHMDVKFMWGNSNYDYVFSEAAGNSGGILCIWEESFFKKDYVTISDSFVAIYGTWIPSKTKLLVVSIYAPQQPSLRTGCGHRLNDKKIQSACSKNSIVSELRDIDKRLDQYGPIDSLIFRRQDLMSNLNDLKEMEDMDFVQKAKVRWAIEGDENSKYFHGIINKKRSNLAIRGVFVDDQVADLRLHVSHDEFIIGPDFCEAVEHFFKQGSFSKGCNSSFIALIPKVLDAKFVNDYRPISLIGCIYKVVTKILASRLAMVIAGLVSNTQSAFVAGRQILDGPFILNEVLDWCKRKKKKALFFKVDFAKAYDSVRWDFLLDVLEAFGFVVEDVFKAFVTGVFGLILIYFMQDEPFLWANGLINLLEVPKGVLKVMESIRSNFFKGASMLEKKIFWIAWDKFVRFPLWSSILEEFMCLSLLDLISWSYWSKRYRGSVNLLVFGKRLGWGYPCVSCVRGLFALDSAPNICVAAKMAGPLDTSFRRSVRGGVEQQEFSDLSSFLNSVVLSTSNDRWRFCIVFAVGGRSISSFGVRSQNGTSGSLLFVFRVQLKVFWKESSTLLGGLFGDFGIVLLLMLISRLDRSFLRILSLPPFFGVKM